MQSPLGGSTVSAGCLSEDEALRFSTDNGSSDILISSLRRHGSWPVFSRHSAECGLLLKIFLPFKFLLTLLVFVLFAAFSAFSVAAVCADRRPTIRANVFPRSAGDAKLRQWYTQKNMYEFPKKKIKSYIVKKSRILALKLITDGLPLKLRTEPEDNRILYYF